MDKEISVIYQTLRESVTPLSTKDISKAIYSQFGIRISKTIVKNYLWSYFRHLITYDPVEYTYSLNNDELNIDDISVVGSYKCDRAISMSMRGSQLFIEFDKDLPIETYVKGIALLNLSRKPQRQNIDIVKQLNRIIEIEITGNERD